MLRSKNTFAGARNIARSSMKTCFRTSTGATFSPSLLADIARFLNLGNSFDPKPKLQKLLQEDIFSYIKNASQIWALMEADEARSSPRPGGGGREVLENS